MLESAGWCDPHGCGTWHETALIDHLLHEPRAAPIWLNVVGFLCQLQVSLVALQMGILVVQHLPILLTVLVISSWHTLTGGILAAMSFIKGSDNNLLISVIVLLLGYSVRMLFVCKLSLHALLCSVSLLTRSIQ